MFYHFSSFSLIEQDASSLLGRLGIYAVSIFFVLSGLSIAIAYNKYIKSTKSSIFFYVRRIFRVWPVLWFAIFLVLIRNQSYSLDYIVLNLTTLYGFLAPEKYMAPGSWSIGNEMVYYLITPFILFLYNKKRSYGNLFTLAAIALGMVYSATLDPYTNLMYQWAAYINPLNNFFLYCIGIALFYNLHKVKISENTLFLLVSAAALGFIFSPFTGDLIVLVTGTGRVLFSLYSVLLVISFYKITSYPPRVITFFLNGLGLSSYSLYLMHPFVYSSVKTRLGTSDVFLIIAKSSVDTLIISFIIYCLFEWPFIKLGKYLTTQKRSARMKSFRA